MAGLTMHVAVTFSGLFYSLAGVRRDTVDMPDGGTINQMIDILGRKHKKLPLQDEPTFYMVNDKISKRDHILKEGDQVRIFQMFAGG